MTPSCINLQERFGDQYRVGFDLAVKGSKTPWDMTMPGRFGLIYPFGGESLAVQVDGHPKIANQVGAIPGIVLHQDGDNEKTFLFPITVFEPVAAIVEPKRVKRLTDERKAKLIEDGKSYQFKNGANEGFLERQAPEKPEGDQEVV